jgi:aspartate/methionine/tyrosine aminotransferase
MPGQSPQTLIGNAALSDARLAAQPRSPDTVALRDHKLATTSPSHQTVDLSSAIVRLPAPQLVQEIIESPERSSAVRRLVEEAKSCLPERLARGADRFFQEEIGVENVLVTRGVRDGLARLIDRSEKMQRGVATMPPCYPGYGEVLRSRNVPSISVPLKLQAPGTLHSFDLERLERVFTPKGQGLGAKAAQFGPGAVIATTPNTPTNSFPQPGNLRSLQSVCERHARLLIVDNTFDTFDLTVPWNPSQLSIRSTVLVGSIHEPFSLTQFDLQIGYMIAAPELIQAIREESRGNGPRAFIPSDKAIACGYAAMFESEGYLDRRNAILRGRHAFADRLKEIPNVVGVSGQAGTTKWVTFSSVDHASTAVEALANHGILVKRGSEYGEPNAIRVSLVSQRNDADFKTSIQTVISVLKQQ